MGWAWPANRGILYNRASADPAGKPWSERKAYVWWDAEWTGGRVMTGAEGLRRAGRVVAAGGATLSVAH